MFPSGFLPLLLPDIRFAHRDRLGLPSASFQSLGTGFLNTQYQQPTKNLRLTTDFSLCVAHFKIRHSIFFNLKSKNPDVSIGVFAAPPLGLEPRTY